MRERSAHEYSSTHDPPPISLNPDGSENREAPSAGGSDAHEPGEGLGPGDVARRVFGPDAQGTACLQGERLRKEREALILADILPVVGFPRSVDARGTEHAVRFRGATVEKHQHTDGWVPILTASRKIGLGRAFPSEYLRRLELQNELFGDRVRLIGLTRGNRFATSQPTLRGDEPTENEIRDLLECVGWRRISVSLQELPIQLMGSAWWHPEERLIMLDARKPNFKRTAFGVLPIDLVLGPLTS